MLQEVESELEPEQVEPPLEGAGLSQLRLLDMLPEPHVRLQEPQEPQEPQFPFTATDDLVYWKVENHTPHCRNPRSPRNPRFRSLQQTIFV